MEYEPQNIRKCYPKRPIWSKKHDFGYVAVVGGSKIYTGAPILSGLAAIRAGADLTYTITPKHPYLTALNYPDLVPIDLETDFLSQINDEAWIALSKSDSLVIGNGITKRFEVADAVNAILSEYSKPVVIDADALHFLSDLDIKSEKSVVTPHISEFKIISGTSPENLDERIKAASDFAKETGLVVLLKGHYDVIAKEDQVIVSKSGTPFMTKGGTGDVLAGVCGALLSRKIDPFLAASSAAYLTGKAGELCYNGEGMTATDLIDMIPKAIKSLTS
ncbi:MAG: NAD(P)H-hydrate dehydratase [Candidatus Altiarchaeota archaeon]|nr:NAD(P)H-hydrate dehydratase [Candidatus Altiarchaeota archaeon]